MMTADFLQLPEKLLNFLDRFVDRTDTMPRQKSAYVVGHSVQQDRQADKFQGHQQVRRIRSFWLVSFSHLPSKVAVVFLHCTVQMAQLSIQELGLIDSSHMVHKHLQHRSFLLG